MFVNNIDTVYAYQIFFPFPPPPLDPFLIMLQFALANDCFHGFDMNIDVA